MKYLTIRPALQTGDVVLFSGKGAISDGIKFFTGSKWSHGGIVIRLPDDYDTVLLWESTTLNNVPDYFTGKLSKGVQVVELSKRLQRYGGDVAVRHLMVSDRTEIIRSASLLRERFKDTPYERDYWQLFKAAYDGLFGKNKRDISSLFCTEMMAELYQHAKKLSTCKPSNEYTPEDWAEMQLPGHPIDALGPLVRMTYG